MSERTTKAVRLENGELTLGYLDHIVYPGRDSVVDMPTGELMKLTKEHRYLKISMGGKALHMHVREDLFPCEYYENVLAALNYDDVFDPNHIHLVLDLIETALAEKDEVYTLGIKAEELSYDEFADAVADEYHNIHSVAGLKSRMHRTMGRMRNSPEEPINAHEGTMSDLPPFIKNLLEGGSGGGNIGGIGEPERDIYQRTGKVIDNLLVAYDLREALLTDNGDIDIERGRLSEEIIMEIVITNKFPCKLEIPLGVYSIEADVVRSAVMNQLEQITKFIKNKFGSVPLEPGDDRRPTISVGISLMGKSVDAERSMLHYIDKG